MSQHHRLCLKATDIPRFGAVKVQFPRRIVWPRLVANELIPGAPRLYCSPAISSAVAVLSADFAVPLGFDSHEFDQSGLPNAEIARARKTRAKITTMAISPRRGRVYPKIVTPVANLAAAAGGIFWIAKTT